MSKGSQRRPTLISREEEILRWDLALGVITMDVFTMKMRDIKMIRVKNLERINNGRV